MGNLVAGIFFLRYWRDGQDLFFLLFALSFFVQTVDRVLLALSAHPNEGHPWNYGVRLVAYLLIIVAVLVKNRARRSTRMHSSRR
jgi:uncharacterized membrane protein HdeD (DUF308 family)